MIIIHMQYVIVFADWLKEIIFIKDLHLKLHYMPFCTGSHLVSMHEHDFV